MSGNLQVRDWDCWLSEHSSQARRRRLSADREKAPGLITETQTVPRVMARENLRPKLPGESAARQTVASAWLPSAPRNSYRCSETLQIVLRPQTPGNKSPESLPWSRAAAADFCRRLCSRYSSRG